MLEFQYTSCSEYAIEFLICSENNLKINLNSNIQGNSKK